MLLDWAKVKDNCSCYAERPLTRPKTAILRNPTTPTTLRARGEGCSINTCDAPIHSLCNGLHPLRYRYLGGYAVSIIFYQIDRGTVPATCQGDPCV